MSAIWILRPAMVAQYEEAALEDQLGLNEHPEIFHFLWSTFKIRVIIKKWWALYCIYITFLKSEKHELTTGENPLASTNLDTPFPSVSFIISSFKSLFLELIQMSAPIFLARSSLASFTSAHKIFLAPNQTKSKVE